MTEAVKSTEDNKKEEALAKIEPVKIVENSSKVDATFSEDSLFEKAVDLEHSVIKAITLLLKNYGIRKSGAAVRDAIDISHQYVGPKEAVSALSNLGFKASFGRLNFKNLTDEFFPLIAFKKNGEAFIIYAAPTDNIISVTNPISRNNDEITIKEYFSEFSQYAIIVKELNNREKDERSGHWFFSAFRKSKWIYVQVMMAAMVSNFLSLSVALFTMTVYDRVIPNGAFESLIALSVGVIIALGFDFLIRSIRANFVDTASKQADLEISRRLFERILTLTPNEQLQKTGAMAGTIREFETLREFFNSSTLVILIDLPFVFFFIYVISLIAGPLAYVFLISVPLVIIVGLGIKPFLARVTRGSVESGMSKQQFLWRRLLD